MLGLVEWLFSILLKKRPAPAVIDPCFGDARALALRGHLTRGDFAAAELGLLEAPDQQTLEHWVHACSDWEGRPTWLDGWVDARPKSFLAHLVRGAHGAHWAWAARSARVADQVDPNAWPIFFARLQDAETDLSNAQRMDPASPLPASFAIRVLTGMQAEEELKWATFERATESVPLAGAHRAMFNALCAKWGGSAEAMFDFARQRANFAPALQVLIAHAHIETFIALDDVQERREYARQRAVHDELISAFTKFREGQDRTATRSGANAFAFMFVLAKDAKRAEQAFALTAGQVNPVPWAYLGDPLARYSQMRASVS